MSVEIRIDVVGCARCHGDGHRALTFHQLAHPVEVPGARAPLTHWASCPTNGEPILLRLFPDPDPGPGPGD